MLSGIGNEESGAGIQTDELGLPWVQEIEREKYEARAKASKDSENALKMILRCQKQMEGKDPGSKAYKILADTCIKFRTIKEYADRTLSNGFMRSGL